MGGYGVFFVYPPTQGEGMNNRRNYENKQDDKYQNCRLEIYYVPGIGGTTTTQRSENPFFRLVVLGNICGA